MTIDQDVVDQLESEPPIFAGLDEDEKQEIENLVKPPETDSVAPEDVANTYNILLIGGGPLLVQTLESNYGVEIDNYARVDFSSLTTIIDIVGGVDMELSAAEVESANGNIYEMCNLQGKDYEANRIKAAGMQHLNGIQAVAYCRIRNVGNADYGRTARQRAVLMAMVNQAKNMGISELNTLINQVLPLVTHNVEQETVLSLISQVPSFLSYEFVTGRVPYDGLFTSKNEILIPNMAETIKRLRETLYAKE